MRPAKGIVLAQPISGNNLILGIPDNYKIYHLEIPNSINVTDPEVDYIYQWTNAAEISIVEQNDLPYRLTMRPHKMKAMTQLWSLQFHVNQGTYAKLRVPKFMKHLPVIELIIVHVDGLSEDQIERFRTNQERHSGWTHHSKKELIEFRKAVDKADKESDEKSSS